SNGHQVLQNTDQTENLAIVDYWTGNVLLSTWGSYQELGPDNTVLGNTFPAGSSDIIRTVFVGSNAGESLTNANYTVSIGAESGTSPTSDLGSIFLGFNTGP